jgi:hypothetical protein
MIRTIAFVILAACLTACSSLYYGTLERAGIHKRDILVDRVDEAREAQVEGQERFRSALEEYRSVIEIDGGDLEERYDKLEEEFESSQSAAERIRDRIDKVEEVAERLFEEWEDELDEYENAKLRRESEQQLNKTRRDYARLINTMRNAEERLDPALEAMQDQVLFLKHNLNARAIASLRTEAATVTKDVDALLSSMQRAIDEANQFLSQNEREDA